MAFVFKLTYYSSFDCAQDLGGRAELSGGRRQDSC